MSQTSSDYAIDEWKDARHVIDKYDDRQHDLRKYGFTFLSALIAADSLTKLFSDVDDRVRLAVVSITLLLTVALRLLDKSYSLFEEAASLRATILENRLNLELTKTIAYRYERGKFHKYTLFVYVSFALAAGLIGILMVYPKLVLSIVIAVLLGISIGLITFINRITPNYRVTVDWSFDRIKCVKGEFIRAIVTNICPKTNISFDKDTIVWEIRKEGNETTAYSQNADNRILIVPGNNYSWPIPTENLEPGIYRFYPHYSREAAEDKLIGAWSCPLRMALIICPKTADTV